MDVAVAFADIAGIVSAFFYTSGMNPSSNPIWNPARLDVRAFALAEQSLQREDALHRFTRLSAEVIEGVGIEGTVAWRCAGEMRSDAAGKTVPWLHLEAKVALPLRCQRCLGPVEEVLEVDRWYRFVADEATAELEDDDSEEDVLALEPRPNITELVEDELLMALPLVPMHDTCPVAVTMQAGDLGAQGEGEPRESPFAQLAKLKK